MQSTSGVLGKWSESVGLAIISLEELSFVNEDSAQRKVVWRRDKWVFTHSELHSYLYVCLCVLCVTVVYLASNFDESHQAFGSRLTNCL